MSVVRRVGVRERPDRVEMKAAHYKSRVTKALGIASRRAARSDATIKGLFASATVEDVALKRGVKSTAISFVAPPFSGGLHQIWGWHQLATLTDPEVATWISGALRKSVASSTAR